MEEINFLSEKKKDKPVKDSGKSDKKDVKWTDPAPAKGASATKRRSFGSIFSEKKTKDKPVSPKDRDEALKMIKSYVDEKEHGSSASGKKVEKKEVKSKDTSKDYQKIFKQEKEVRKNGKKTNALDYAVNQTEKGVKKEVKSAGKKLSALIFIKKKLGLGDDTKKESKVLATDLIRSEIVTFFDWKKNLRNSIFVVAVCFLLIGSTYGGLILWEQQKKEAAQKISDKFTGLEAKIKIAEASKDEILAFQKKMELVKALLDNHVYWTNFFEFLEKNTLKDVHYFDFGGDSRGNYTLSARAKDFYIIAEQVKRFREHSLVRSITVSEGRVAGAKDGDQVGVDFDLNISLEKKIFIKE